MIVKEIVVNGDYYIGGVGLGKARVISEPRKKWLNGRTYEVDIEFVDAPPTISERRRLQTVDTKNIQRYWNDKDQQEFTQLQQNVENKRGWEEELRLAGYDGVVNYNRHEDNKLTVSFSGYIAEHVLEKLTGIEFPEEQKVRNAR